MNNLYCPICGAELVGRTNRRTLTQFLACSEYPECTYTESIDYDTENVENKHPTKQDNDDNELDYQETKRRRK